MPSLEHEGIVALFRDNPLLALRVLENIFHVPLPPHATVRVADTSLSQLIPTEFRADLVLEVLNVQDARNAFVMAIVLESQREIKERKRYSWPVYVAVSRAERECPVILMVVAVDEEVAEWAAQSIDLGAGRGRIEPVVLGPRTIPEITEEQVARINVELALLSGMAHGNGTNGEKVLLATLEGMRTLDDEHAMVYYEILWKIMRAPMQKALEKFVMEQRNTPREFTFVKELGKHFFHDGEVKGFHDGEVKGEIKGGVKAIRNTIIRLATRAGLVLSDEQQQRIDACDDRQALDRWLDNILDAKTADEIFR